MSGRRRFLVLLAFGAVVLRCASGPRLLAYVRPSSRPYLLVSGALVAVLGAALWLAPVRPTRSRMRTGYLLLAPIAAMVLVVPPSQGALVGHPRHVPPVRTAAVDSTLHGAGPIDMTLSALVQRAIWAPRSLRGHLLRIRGFLVARKARVLVIGRLAITCCAADAQQDDLEVRADPKSHSVDLAVATSQWVAVTGRFVGVSATAQFVPKIAATTVLPVAAPANPYD